MRSTLVRLYQTKLTLLAALFVLAGVILVAAGKWAGEAGPGWLQAIPLGEFGGTFLSAGLFGVFLYYLDQKDSQDRARQQLDEGLKRAAPNVVDALLTGFAFKPDDLAKVASPQVLDAIATNALTLQLGDRSLAEGVYGQLRRQVLTAPERNRSLRVTVTLSPWEHGQPQGLDSMFVATVRREYWVKLSTPVLRFSCVSSRDEYREALADPTTAEAWFLDSAGPVDAGSPEAFELLEFTVNGAPRTIRRSQRRGASSFRVAVDPRLVGNGAPEVKVAYTFRVLALRHGHVLYLEVGRPTKGAEMELRHGGCGIAHVNALAFGGGGDPAKLWHSPADSSTPSVGVGYEGWVLPGAGVGFVWVLEEEVAQPRLTMVGVNHGHETG